jgi:hypothetical protein
MLKQYVWNERKRRLSRVLFSLIGGAENPKSATFTFLHYPHLSLLLRNSYLRSGWAESDQSTVT